MADVESLVWGAYATGAVYKYRLENKERGRGGEGGKAQRKLPS